MSNLSIISANCGLGKTYHLVKSVYTSNELYHVIAAPSIQIAQQIKSEFKTVAADMNVESIEPTIINTESYSGRTVSESIRSYLTNLTGIKQVLIITHTSYHNTPKSFLKGCVVHVDEIPSNWIESVSVKYDWNHSHEQYFNTSSDGLVSLTKDANGDNDTLENSTLHALIQMIKDGSVFVHELSNYEYNNTHIHNYLAVINPDYFTSKTILYTADAHVSDIVTILKKQMDIVTTTLPDSGRVHHYNTDQIEFVYFMDDRKNSLNVSETMADEYDAGLKLIMDSMNGCTSLLLMNKKIQKRMEDAGTIPENFKPINHNIHGINGYSYLTKIVIQSATNRSPDEEKCLINFYNLTEEQIFNSRIANIHQAIMRLAIRRQNFNQNPAVNEAITVGVVDLQTAFACKSLYFPNATLTKLGNATFKARAGRPKGAIKEDRLSKEDSIKGRQIRQKIKDPEKYGFTKQDVLAVSMCDNIRDLMKLPLWNEVSKSGIKVKRKGK